MSTLAVAPERAGENPPASAGRSPYRTPHPDFVVGLAVAAGVVALAFLSSGSVDQTVTGAGTWSQIVLILLGAAGCATAVLRGAPARRWGAGAVAAFVALTAWTALSILWSVQPDWSWFGIDQLLSYLAIFAGAAAAGRCFPQRWPGLVGGLAAGMAVLGAYALLAKVFPASLAPDNTYGRLQAPFGYWNAVGLSAALGLPACLWAATRRTGRRWLRGLCVPAMTVLIAVVVLSYSRSALLATVVALSCWIALTPLRLRATLLLALAAAGAAPITLWALHRPGLAGDGVAIGVQDSAGHTFGWILVIVIVVMAAVGVVAVGVMDRISLSPSARRRIGTVLIVLVALVPVAGVVALAASSRGLTGEVSHAWSTLTSSTSRVGNTSNRVTQLGSSRPLYWHQGLQVAAHALLKGRGELGYGIARLRYATSPAKSDQAHSYIVQTLADLGLVGMVLTLVLLLAWAAAARRAVELRPAPPGLGSEQARERQALLALLGVALAFGIQSTLDWTWYFPGVAGPALLAAGWLAGRGPLRFPVGRRLKAAPVWDRPGAAALVLALAAVAVLGGWFTWQPLRSVQALNAAASASTNAAALADTRAAVARDPLALAPRLQLSILLGQAGDPGAARAALVQATADQPENPQSWAPLGALELGQGRLLAARSAMLRVLALDHSSDPYYAQALTAVQQIDAVLAARAQAARAAAARAARQRRARAASSRRHSGGPVSPVTSTSAQPIS